MKKTYSIDSEAFKGCQKGACAIFDVLIFTEIEVLFCYCCSMNAGGRCWWLCLHVCLKDFICQLSASCSSSCDSAGQRMESKSIPLDFRLALLLPCSTDRMLLFLLDLILRTLTGLSFPTHLSIYPSILQAHPAVRVRYTTSLIL